MNRSFRAYKRKRGLVRVLLACIFAAALEGCGSLGMDGSLRAAQVRFVQVSAGGSEMDFYVNGSGAAYGLGFASFTSYLPVSPGSVNLGVTKAGSGLTLVQAQSGLTGGHQYTAVLSHGMADLREVVFADQDSPAPQGQIALRVLNEVDGVAATTVYVIAVGSAASAGASTSTLTLNTGAASVYVLLPAGGSYTVTSTVPGGALNVPIASVTVKAVSGAVRTVVFAGPVQVGGHGVVGFALEDQNTP